MPARPLYILPLMSLIAAILLAACGGESPEAGSGADQSPRPTRFVPPGVPGGRIVLVSSRDGNQEIYTIKTDGRDERRVTRDDADDFDPDWSPDGRRLAFVSKRHGKPQVFIARADGSDVRQLTDSPQGALAPSWSRDGRQIVFTRAGSLVIADVESGDTRVVMEAQPEGTAEDCRAGAYAGNWSPGDEEIIYYSASVSRQQAQICTVKADGSDIRVLVAEEGEYNVEPAWSPDGRKIVYRAITDGVHDIWLLELETGERTNLTSSATTDIEPAWSPDGEWIVFARLESDRPHFDLFIIKADGSDAHFLTGSNAKESYPGWTR